MRKNAKKFIDIKCDTCGNLIHKELKEYNRRIRENKHKFYCNFSCAAKANEIIQKNIVRVKNGEILYDISQFSKNRQDEYSSFRNFINKANSRGKSNKRRYMETNLTLEYLKELWEKQDGICPYTGIKMYLPYNSSDSNNGSLIRASLDRIDSKQGYIKGNVEFVCLGINYAKNGFTKEEVLKFIENIK